MNDINAILHRMQVENISAAHAIQRHTKRLVLVQTRQNPTVAKYYEIYLDTKKRPLGVVKKHADGEFQAITVKGELQIFPSFDSALLGLFATT